MVTTWCVKVTCLPLGVNNGELAGKFGVHQDTIDVPPNQQGPNYYALVNGFLSEQHANDFVSRWNNIRIRSGTIKCKALPAKSHLLVGRPPSVSRINENQSRVGGKQQQYDDNGFEQSLASRHILTSMMFNKNNDSDDEDNNQPKNLLASVSQSDITNAFQSKTRVSSATGAVSNLVSIDGLARTSRSSCLRIREDSCASRTPACRKGSDCFNPSCPYRHPSEWYACEDGSDCQNFNCQGNHPHGRVNPCSEGEECKDFTCHLLHPSTRTRECEAGDQCREWNCKALHSQNRPKRCFFEQQCYNNTCLLLHPPDRQLCRSGAECVELTCPLSHPLGRPIRCKQGNACSNFHCMDLHPIEWDPCEAGSECRNLNCPHTPHPSDCILHLLQNTTSKTYRLAPRKELKSRTQRDIDRQQKKELPILASKDEFCRRLKEERMLIVIAETGSGKSTQLPQYAAEYFGGLVVCTQPRVVAAISLARRVASEYDGTSVGESVGYQVGYGGAGRDSNRVPGRDILFMTDSALVQESQKDKQLSKIKVLIIDEAHERSLNTDIIIGLAKLLLNSRLKDFYVVIASATIDPVPFLTFFKRSDAQVLNVLGRVNDVSVEYIPKADDSTDDQVVSTVIKYYNEQLQGHILVFLPGQREIEKALELFSRDIPDNCVALPLYGSLSSEEQDRVLQFDEGPLGERRMVVFCTNVAETSLTIENTRLVIDSGWAKEARFDPKRRLTVIETVRISKSSANQRKGRAGRTAPGHCVRLYNENELTRFNIEPEIRRSSLDLVVLQLLRLRLNPSQFPFIDAPENSVLQKSLYLLQELGCIDKDQTITLRGELFAELGLDPRLSAFMVDTHIMHSPVLELTTTIVAILTAPGSLFFMGGATKEEKQAARGRVAIGAQEHDSDLLYLVSVYKKWQNIGIIDPVTRTCLTCQISIKRVNSCRLCRAAYSMEHVLNNKILNNIEVASNSAITTITNKRWQIRPSILSVVNESDIIGGQLFKNFPEQYGHLLVPHLPNEGAYMVTNDFRARINNTSVFVQRQIGSNHFIAMSITKLSTGDYVIERLHPISRPESTHMKAIQQLVSISNVGWERNHEIRKQINDVQAQPWSTWLVYEYDRRECKLIIWGEENSKKALDQTLTPIVKNTLDSLFARSRSFDCGPMRASFESGLVSPHIENLHHSSTIENRIDLQHIPCKSFEDLDEWLDSVVGIHLKDIRENNFRPYREATLNDNDDYEASPFFIVFKSEETFKNALAKVPSYHICPHRSDPTDILHMNEKDAWGRQLLLTLKSDQFCTEKDIKDQIGEYIVSCKQLGRKLLPGLSLNNMPANVGEEYIQNALGKNLICTRINIFHSNVDDHQIGSTSARIYFNNEEQCRNAQRRLQSNFFRQPHWITIYSKKWKKYKEISVQPSLEKLRIEPQKFLCTARSRRVALDIYSKLHSFMVDSSSCVTVTHLALHPKFEQLLEHICGHFHVQVQKHPLPNKDEHFGAVRCIFRGANPPKTAMAASVLSQATSPIIIKLTDDRQKCLFNELFNENLMQTWTNELKLSCEKKDKYGTVIEIYGPQIEQGQLMRRIADYSDKFEGRYRVLDLSPETIGYFGRHKAADIKLQGINSKWTAEGCNVTFIRRTSTILLYAQPKVSPEMINNCESEVKELLDNLVVTNTDDEKTAEQQEFARQCAFCQHTMAATRTFRICGHAYCRCALGMLNKIPMRCPTCHFRIHIQDVQEMFSNNRADFMRLCKTSIQTYLLSSANSKDNDQLFCPNDECDGLIIRSQVYQTCLTCGQSVCGMCRLIDDELHEGRTCTERNEAQRTLGDFLPRLFQEAETFTKNNWPLDLPPIVRFDHNTHLHQAACESLQRFYKGVKSIGDNPPPDLARGFFAFHGTSVNAIEPICESGFDPTRRRGQVHGPGEYFGVTAAISHGYSKADDSSLDCRMMIIAFILRCDRVKTQKGFCYVVNNPVDCSAAFNLPVAVVTYGKDIHVNHPSPFIMHTTSSTSTKATGTSILWKSPFRWHWRQDNGIFEPYNDKINGELEQLYERWKLGNGPSNVITSPLVRYVDDIPQTYSIDFPQNTQTHTKTMFTRQIKREAMSPSKIGDRQNWYFRNEHNEWTPYESLVQQTIENAYQLYLSERGPSTLVVHFPGRPEPYEIDFTAGKQMNKMTTEIRLIARK